MAEDTLEAKLKISEVTHRAKPPRPLNPEALKRSIESGIKKGKLSSEGIPPKSSGPSPTFPTEKLWPTKEKQAEALAAIPYQKEAVPVEVKEELTEAARKFNTLGMPEHLEAKGGQAPLKRIIEARKKIEQVRQRTVEDTLSRASRVPEEAKEYVPASLQKRGQTLAPSPKTPPPAPEIPKEAAKTSFLRRVLDKLGRI